MSDPLREYVVLPRDPTLAMLEAGFGICTSYGRPDPVLTNAARARYNAMIETWSTVANRTDSGFPLVRYRAPVTVSAKDFKDAMERANAVPVEVLQAATIKAVEKFRASEF